MKNKALATYITTLILLFLLPGILPAQEVKKEKKTDGIRWMSFEEAYNLIKKKPKKVFIDVYTDWCGWCKKMDAETFANPVIAKYMSENFYCVKLDAERKDTVVLDGQMFTNPNPSPGARRSTHKLAVELLQGKMSYPSYVFLNEKGQRLQSIAGYQQAREFEAVVNFFGSDAHTKTGWEDFRRNFVGKIK